MQLLVKVNSEHFESVDCYSHNKIKVTYAMSAYIVGMILIPYDLYLCLYISNETVLSMLLVFVQPMTLCTTVPCCGQLHPLPTPF